MERYDVNNTQVQLTMVIKLQQLRRTSLHTLRYQDLEKYLSQHLWKRRLPVSLHEAVNQVMSVTADDMIRFFALEAIKDGSRNQLKDYTDLIGGK